MRSLGLLAAAFALAALPAAQAHVTVTATAPGAPLIPGVPNTIQVGASASCATVLTEYNAEGKDTLHWGLAPESAAYWTVTSEDVPFDAQDCNPLGPLTVDIKGTLVVIPRSAAPALTPLGLTIVTYNGDSTTPEGGDPAVLNVTVAYKADATLEAGPAVRHTDAGNATTYTLPLTITYSANAPSTLALDGTASVGTLKLPSALALDPPAFSNKTALTRHAEAIFTPPSGAWGGAELKLMAHLTPKGATTPMTMLEATAKIAPPEAPVPGATASGSSSKSSPAPSLALAGVLLAAALLRRR